MLNNRLITALILMPLVVLSVLNLSTEILEWFSAGVIVIAAWEWFSIIKIGSIRQRNISLMILGMFGIFAWLLLNPNTLLLLVIILWGVAILLIINYAYVALPVLVFTLFFNRYFVISLYLLTICL